MVKILKLFYALQMNFNIYPKEKETQGKISSHLW